MNRTIILIARPRSEGVLNIRFIIKHRNILMTDRVPGGNTGNYTIKTRRARARTRPRNWRNWSWTPRQCRALWIRCRVIVAIGEQRAKRRAYDRRRTNVQTEWRTYFVPSNYFIMYYYHRYANGPRVVPMCLEMCCVMRTM